MDELWPCQACTFLNPPKRKSCEICETPRGKDSSASPYAQRTAFTSSSPSAFVSSTSRYSYAEAGGFEASAGQTEAWDEVGQRLDICRKRDYRFLSLEALSLTELPATVAESLNAVAEEDASGIAAQEDSHMQENGHVTTDGADLTSTTIATDHRSKSELIAPLPLNGARLISQLTALFLNDNNLTVFPEELTRLRHLRELHMHYNSLVTLPPSIGNFSQLEKLFLSHNALVSLPAEIGRLSSLQTLSLFNNHLTSVPPQLGQLKSLQSLFLNDNALTSLPPLLFYNLSNLVVLQLNSNKLSSLPAQIGHLSHLKKLNVDRNALVTAPASIALLSELSMLSFRRNLFHYAVSGTWNTGPSTLLHLACAAVRSNLRQLSLSPDSHAQRSDHQPTRSEEATPSSPPSNPPPAAEAQPPSPVSKELLDPLATIDRWLARDDARAGKSAPGNDDAENELANGNSNDGVEEVVSMVHGLRITEDLKKLLLEGESACSVCGKLMYGDGPVVRVFPVQMSFIGGMRLSLASTNSGDAPAAPAPAPTLNPLGGPNRLPTLVVRGTYCSWKCAKRQIPTVGRPERTCAAAPSTAAGPRPPLLPLPLPTQTAPGPSSPPPASSHQL